MPTPHFQSITDQVAAYLREQLLCGRWHGEMPGQNQLVKLLGVSSKTIEMALRILEGEGLLIGQGAGRRRRIVLPEGELQTRGQRVAILDYEQIELSSEGWSSGILTQLIAAGHDAFIASKTLKDMQMKVSRVAHLVKKNKADAWVVWGGSRDVLKWFSAQPTPTFAGFGRMEDLPIAGIKPDKKPAQSACIRRLVELGHRRIVVLVRQEVRLPKPGRSVRHFLAELESHGLETGPYNLPDWADSPEGLQRGLDSLFEVTPPTALIADGSHLFFAVQQFLAKRGLQVPEDVSLVCTDANRNYWWCRPTVSHVHWSFRPVLRRIERWVANIARGKDDRRQSFTKAEFVEGGTIGPAPGSG